MLKVGIVIYVAAVIFFFLLRIEASNTGLYCAKHSISVSIWGWSSVILKVPSNLSQTTVL